MSYRDHFNRLTGIVEPHPWQCELAATANCESRLIRIPTGFGKTLGVLSVWTYHRVHLGNEHWPRRLVWCMPMRVLVEQTEKEVREALDRLGLLWDEKGNHSGKVGVHLLMGGADAAEWHLHPEDCAVLIGTQDMLLSRALNRGYGAARARWPMDFGLLNEDCLWIMDEVQLMDAGLATSGQLQSFRLEDQRAQRSMRPCYTWWMSATLQRFWLQASPESYRMGSELPQNMIGAESRRGALWGDVRKPLRIESATDAKTVARLVSQAHIKAGEGKDGPTLVVLNRVEDAVEVHALLRRDKALVKTELRLVHSRFRPRERANWQSTFLNRAACSPRTDRIIVATQVIEAGVDISAAVLVTQMAPWPSLVQRFGRAARWGGEAQVIVVDSQPKDDKAAAPYTKEAVDGSRKALAYLTDAAPLHLETFEDAHAELLSSLYPYAPKHLLLRHELDELFDTTPDLSGADVDISRFIRSGEERDLHVFWLDISHHAGPERKIKPAREALCTVPAYKAREWLCKEGSESLRSGRRAWVWDYLEGAWREAARRDLYPGQTVLVAAQCGGYDPETGWNPKAKDRLVPTVPAIEPTLEEQADAAQDDESLSAFPWQTIAVHGSAVGREAGRIAGLVDGTRQRLFELAGRWHDVGKAHEAFNNSIRDLPERPRRNDLAKAPEYAWLPPKQCYSDNRGQRRGGFRHELASTLALFAVLERHNPEHTALLGPWRDFFEAAGLSAKEKSLPSGQAPNALEREILELSAEEFDLLAYLICSHHGKVRCTWHAVPADQAAADDVLRIRGIRDGDVLPPVVLATSTGELVELPETRLRLDAAAAGLNPVTGRGWTERTLILLKQHGPFTLAYFEALLRISDQRASRQPLADPLLTAENAAHGLETSDRRLAKTAVGGAPAATSARDPAARGQLHGDGGRARQRTVHSRMAEPSPATTRYIETALGVLSYAELAPYLAECVAALEADIADRVFATQAPDCSLLLEFHRRICGNLVPEIAGRWRSRDVQVGAHQPPPAWQVPSLMHEYGADLTARISHANCRNDELLLELLAFAEGRLLHIHPFSDFNGRVTRLFLIELLYRLDLPIVDTATSTETERQLYFTALRAYDSGDPRPLAAVWRERFERGNAE